MLARQTYALLILACAPLTLVSCESQINKQISSASLDDFRSAGFQRQLCTAGPTTLDPLFDRLSQSDPNSDLQFEVAQAIRLVASVEYQRQVPAASISSAYDKSATIGPWIDPVPLQTWWSVNREKVMSGTTFELPPGLYDTQGMSFADGVDYMSRSEAKRKGGADEPIPEIGYLK